MRFVREKAKDGRAARLMLAVAMVAAALAVPELACANPLDGGWQAEYWDNPSLHGSPTLVQQVQAVGFEWGFGSPGAGISADNWSARWTRVLNFEQGWYRFQTFTDDGVRVWVDGELLIDRWFDMPGTYHTGDVYLAQGAHEVKMEYYEHMGWARAYLRWYRLGAPPTPTQWQGEYFANRWLLGFPVLVRQDEAVKFNWGWGSPGSGIPSDGFSARWTREVAFTAGNYRFYVRSDDGARLWVDSQLVVDRWSDPATVHFGDAYLTGGKHAVKLEYYENGGVAEVELWWEPIAIQTDAWLAEYFANATLSGAPVAAEAVAQVDFDWGEDGPGHGVGTDGFSARYTATLEFASGLYTFYVRSDDGVRLWVDGNLVLDRWSVRSATQDAIDMHLDGGAHQIRLEYFEEGGLAEVSLWWEKRDTGSAWEAQYFTNPWLIGQPAAVRAEDSLDFDWGLGSPAAGIPADDFSARWTRTLTLSAARTMTFYVRCDDGVRLWIDGQLVMDRWYDQAASKTHSAQAVLPAGTHTVALEYYEHSGFASVKLWWQ